MELAAGIGYLPFVSSLRSFVNFPAGDEYTCLKFTVQINNSAEVSIPSLTNWKYFFSLTEIRQIKKGEFWN